VHWCLLQELLLATAKQDNKTDNSVEVELWACRIPFMGKIADHHWLVINNNGKQSRWEVWQFANVIRNDIGESWDHLHRDLLPLRDGVRGGLARHLETWSGDEAAYLAKRIEASPQQYPWCSQYRYVPGPNSNTYVQWILWGYYKLGRKGVGKIYCRLTDPNQYA